MTTLPPLTPRTAGPMAHRPSVPAPSFRSLMAHFPAGVAVVTAMAADGRPRGMTCTALSSVSDRPPTLLVCVQQSSRTLAAIDESSTFAVNLLHRHARCAAERFASDRPDRFDQVPWEYRAPSHGGPHLLGDAHTVADCRVTGMVTVADHTVVFAEVFSVTERTDDPTPLLYALRDYWSLDEGGSGAPAGSAIRQTRRTD
ncbi:flavin reductase family protein [Streptomyces sp. RLB3-17]|uniref:flavin reductase family protein n=1 Tax=Streptomyces sp. RLB3-17 TaxID=2594455 RepID=UPI001CECA790|nr:flavin reductase family protein [Streptomyces sp. RLB3-17]